MNYSGLKLIWNTNETGLMVLASSILFQVWLSFCNEASLTWQMMNSGRDMVELTWKKLWVDMFAENDFLIRSVGTTLWGFIWFILVNSIFTVVDMTGFPHWLHKHKIQDGKNDPVEKGKLIEAIKMSMFNLVVVSFVALASSYPFQVWWGALRTTGTLPTFGKLVALFFGFRILKEIVFYYGHRMLHLPQFYKYHKKHHEWTAPIGMASLYCEPAEYFFTNFLAVSAGPFFFQSHILVTWLWIVHETVYVVVEHCGYHVPFMHSCQGHDYHHKTFNSWYGSMAFLDVLHGTDKPFTSSINRKRHFVSCSFTPVKETVPDTNCKTK